MLMFDIILFSILNLFCTIINVNFMNQHDDNYCIDKSFFNYFFDQQQ